MHREILGKSGEAISKVTPVKDKFADLKNILFQDDLSRLQESISANTKDINQSMSAEAKTELFDQFLVSALQEKAKSNPEELAQILSTVLPDAFSSVRNRDQKNKLTEQLSPFVGKALKTQIQKEKDTIIDILYPIIGTLISKYIKSAFAELNETINTQVESALPINIMRRRIKSKMTGLSESEILFQESIQSHIKSFYLIHKATGVVVASSHSEDSHAEETQESMIGGMFSAITHFVNDWIESGKEDAELSSIDYGDSTISFISSGHLMAAIVVKGELSPKLKGSMRKLLIQLSSEHQSFIGNFDGDTSSVPEEIEKSLNKTLNISNIEIKEKPALNKKHVLLTLVVGVILFGAYKYFL